MVVIYQNSIMEKFKINLNTECEFFVGNLNKTKTRDEIFKELTSQITIDSLDGENLYIRKFNMPKFNARKDKNGVLLLNLGYAFITTSKPEMAQELIKRGRMELEDGTDIEFKPISSSKRLKANENCKQKNLKKYNNADGTRSEDDGINGDWRNHKNRKIDNSIDFNSFSYRVEPQYNSKPYFETQNDQNNNNNDDSIFNPKNLNSSKSFFD